MKNSSGFGLLLGLVVLGALSPAHAGSPDGIDLTVSKGPGPEEVQLVWAGGQPGFEVFRATSPQEVAHPLNLLGQTNANAWADSAPPSPLYFYLVRSTCFPNPPDICDGLDNDCDGRVDEDHVTAPTMCGVGACEGNTGVLSCRNGREIDTCDPFAGATPEVCDGVDNDCDADSVDGSGDPQYGLDCDGLDEDLCSEGTYFCRTGSLICTDFTGTTIDVCNGLDDDCDAASADGSDDAQVGVTCDGGDGDLCNEGTQICSSGSLACTDSTGTTIDLCNGADDDCDAVSADGSEDPQLGTSCDGADGDLCAEGTRVCSSGSVTCTDSSGTTIDLCNGANDDCDAASADGTEDPLFGVPCDGADGDLCTEGTRICPAGALTCTDNTGTTVDLCNGLNEDCDAASADGSEDPLVGIPCDGADGDLCIEGTRTCTGGGLSCTDNTGTTPEQCNGFDDDCDGVPDDGINTNDNPACSATTFFVGSLAGDTGNATLEDSWHDEEWDRITIREDSNSIVYLSATIRLFSPPGMDFDLFVRCASCGGGVVASSTAGGLTGHYDQVLVRANDQVFVDDTFDVIVEIRYFDSTVCGNWTLEVFGNTVVNNATCD